jgi:putative Mg2+ transporter-C (MgtC) family protein
VADVWDIGLKILAAALLGGLVGAERERRGKWAGLRTHMLIAVGSALLTHLSIHIGEFQDDLTRWDPGRIAAQIVTGVGFIGAGTIIQSRGGVQGLTTAAGLWVAAAVGMAAGARFYTEAAVTAVVLLVVLAAMRPVERLLKRDLQELILALPPDRSLARVAEVLEERDVETDLLSVQEREGHRIVHLRFHGDPQQRRKLVAAFDDAGIPMADDD